VKNARLLKIRRFGLIQETTVTEKHRPQHSSSLRSVRKELINLVAQSPSCSSENRSDGRSPRRDPFD